MLDDKIVWITGAGSGIGEAGAVALAKAGALVVLTGRRREPLEETAAEIGGAGGRAEVEPLDIADAAAVKAAAERIRERHGRIDILVNCAGINVPNRHWPEMTPADWDRVVAIDLNGAYYCVDAVLPDMRARKDGLIINIASWAGRYDSYVTGPAYNAAKHGLLAMSASLNLEESENGIRASVICPGEVSTPILDKRPVPPTPEDKARMLQPEDLAATILYVARMPARVCVNEVLISPTVNRLVSKG
ncbi:MAG: SDR family oxidoreductase [Alphaproteobacteria bacterium]|nr:SDR family oxidoreductase [Alphaproteobacteria bacterium]